MEGRLPLEKAMFNLAAIWFAAPHSLRLCECGSKLPLAIHSVAEHYYKGALKQRDVIAADEVTPVIRSGNFEEWPLKRV